MRYVRKLSGPLLDRVDLHVTVPALSWRDAGSLQEAEASAAVRGRVERARERASLRAGISGFRNADITAALLERCLALDVSARRALPSLLDRLGLSMRALHRALRVARTIADLEESDAVTAVHVAEAVGYRPRAGLSDRVDRALPGP